jgi:Domain of unknown function (DUF4349)
MNTSILTAPSRAGLRIAALSVAAVMSGACLLLAGCSAAAPASSASGSSASGSGASAPSRGPAARGTVGGGEAVPAPAVAGRGESASASTTGLIVPGQSIIYTAGLTVRAANVATAASLATSIVTAAGGYVASEQATIRPAGHARPAVSLQLKIPVAAYGATLRRLSGSLGSQTALSQHAQDVTAQVADVTSRVASAKAAITQLRALLRRAGSVSGLLGVQDQINAEESQLEALQAEQRALGHETTYATVSLRLVSKHAPSVVAKSRSHGFLAGFSAGWRALRVATSWLLTAAGAVLPFALIAALAGGIALGGRRRVLRRRAGPTTAG